MASETHAEGFHVPPLGIRQYVYITLFLGAVTVVELLLSYSDFNAQFVAAALILLSAVKFGTVVALFMHLKFEARLFTQMFLFGLILGGAILIALIAVFWNDPSDALGGKDLPPLEHEAAAHQLFLGAEDTLL
jgi:cytochrome c oxidase subunit IV